MQTYFVGSLLKKEKKRKEQWKEWDTWKIHILNSWTKIASSFFSSCQAISTYDSKKPQFDIGFRTKFKKNTLSENMHGIPTDTNIKHRRMESDRPVRSLLLAYQVTSSLSLYLPNVLLDCKLLVARCLIYFSFYLIYNSVNNRYSTDTHL